MPATLAQLVGDPRDVAVRLSNAATNILFTDRNGCVRKSDTGTHTWTVTTDAAGGWDRNVAIIVANDGASTP